MPVQYRTSNAEKLNGLSDMASLKRGYSSFVQNFIASVVFPPILSTHLTGLPSRP